MALPAPTAADLATPLVQPIQITNQETSGSFALVAGTKTIAAPWVRNSSGGGVSKIFLQLTVANTTTLTVQYQVITKTDGVGFTVQANIAAGTINVADISSLDFFGIP